MVSPPATHKRTMSSSAHLCIQSLAVVQSRLVAVVHDTRVTSDIRLRCRLRESSSIRKRATRGRV